MKEYYLMLFLSFGSIIMPANSADLFPYEVHRQVLDNQFKVIMIPMESPGLVSFYSIVRTGSRDEYEPGHTGFAHFFEHMMFRGTVNYPGDAYDRIMTEMGADANAYTSDDLTCYHLNIAKEDLETVMKLESDRFQNLSYSEQAFKTEAGAIYGEYLKSLSSPWRHLSEKLQSTAFLQHTYRHDTIGFRRDIEAMPTMYQYSLDFCSRYYRPENVVLLVVGDIDIQVTLTLVKKYYGNWLPGYKPPQISPEPVQTAQRFADVRFPGRSLPIVALAYKSPAFDAQNTEVAADNLFSEAAFGSTSDLYKKLVIDEQRVQFIEIDFGFSRDPGLMTLYAMVNDPKDVPSIVAEFDKTITHFQQHHVSLQKLQDLKNHAIYSFLMNMDTPEKVAGRLARFIALTGDMQAVNDYYATVQKVTPEDIFNIANKHFTAARRTQVVLKGEE